MSQSQSSVLQPEQVLDTVFSHLQTDLSDNTPAPRARLPESAVESAPKPLAPESEDEWLAEERRSLEEFTKRQFQIIRQQQANLDRQRSELLDRQNALNESCLLRQQELNRQLKVVEARIGGIENRERDINDQENQLAVDVKRLERAKEELLTYRHEIAQEEEFVEELRSETKRLLECEVKSRRQVAEQEKMLRERWQEWKKEQESYATRRSEAESRLEALDQAEEALQRRLRELEEMEELSEKREASLDEREAAIEAREQEALTKLESERFRLMVLRRKLEKNASSN